MEESGLPMVEDLITLWPAFLQAGEVVACLDEAGTLRCATVFTTHCSFPDTQTIYHLLAEVNLHSCFLTLNRIFL